LHLQDRIVLPSILEKSSNSSGSRNRRSSNSSSSSSEILEKSSSSSSSRIIDKSMAVEDEEMEVLTTDSGRRFSSRLKNQETDGDMSHTGMDGSSRLELEKHWAVFDGADEWALDKLVVMCERFGWDLLKKMSDVLKEAIQTSQAGYRDSDKVTNETIVGRTQTICVQQLGAHVQEKTVLDFWADYEGGVAGSTMVVHGQEGTSAVGLYQDGWTDDEKRSFLHLFVGAMWVSIHVTVAWKQLLVIAAPEFDTEGFPLQSGKQKTLKKSQ
jgi:hypothetical protein